MIQKEVANFMKQTKGDGYNVVVGTHFDQVRKWLSWFRGNVQDFHYYDIVGLNNKITKREKKTLNMAKTVCEDTSSLEVGEDTSVNVDREDWNNHLQEVLRNNSFETEFKQHLELSKGLGDAFMIEYISKGRTYIDFVNPQKAVITKAENGRVFGITTITEHTMKKSNGKKVTIWHLQIHDFDREKGYSIEHRAFQTENKAYLGKNNEINAVAVIGEELAKSLWTGEMNANGQPIYRREMDDAFVPMFQRLYPNIKNNYNIDSVYGLSIYANAIDTLKAIDNKYDAYDLEFTNGRSRLFVDSSLTEQYTEQLKQDGEYVTYTKFRGDNDVFVSLPELGANGNKNMVEFSPELREEQISNGINNELSFLGTKVGLGKNHYEFKSGVVANTATEVKSQDNQKWQRIKADRKITERALKDMARAILYLGWKNGDISGSHSEIAKVDPVVHFDDSVAIDQQSKIDHAKEMYQLGAYSLTKLLIADGFSKEEAKEMIEERKKEQDDEENVIFGDVEDGEQGI